MSEDLSRRDRKKLQAKLTISEIALHHFLSKGFTDTTVAEIMEEADLGVGTFYNYFESKEDILKYCLSEKINSVYQTLEDIKLAEQKSSAKLAQLLLTIGKTYKGNRKLLMLYMHYYRSNKHNHKHPPHMSEFQDIIAFIIQEGQQNEEFRKDIPGEIMVELFKGILKSAMTSKSEIPFLENLQYKLSLFLDGVMIRQEANSNDA